MAISLKIIKQTLKRHRGLVTPAARALGMSYQGLNKRIKNNKSLQAVREAAREENIDRNIGVLEIITDKALSPEATAEDLKLGANVAKYLLDRIGKHRGYVVQVETKDVTEHKKQIIKIGNQIIEFNREE